LVAGGARSCLLVLTPSANAVEAGRANSDVRALVKLGPRVTGTPVMDRHLPDRGVPQAGYVAEVQTFTYPKFEDLGSNLSVGKTTIEGWALNGSLAGQPTAPLVAVPNVGRAADFASVDVKGAIAIVRRGKIRFLEKAQNAAAAGAVGLVLVNTESGNLSGGALGGEAKFSAGSQVSVAALLERARVSSLRPV